MREHPEGVVVDAWAVAGTSRNEVVGMHGDAIKVKTTAPPQGGRANRAIARMLADAFGGSGGRVVGGHASRRKQVLVSGIDLAAAQLVAAALQRDDS